MFAFPNLFLALLFVTLFDATTETLIVAVGVGTAPGYARMIWGQFLVVKSAGYVEAARASGILGGGSYASISSPMPCAPSW